MNRQTIILILVVILFGGIGFVWYRYLQTLPPEPEIPTETKAATENALNLAELRRLKTLNLDTTILENPLFRSLETTAETFTPDIAPGNINPFVPRE